MAFSPYGLFAGAGTSPTYGGPIPMPGAMPPQVGTPSDGSYSPDGLLSDFRQRRLSRGLLEAGASLMGGPSRLPITLGSQIGQALHGFGQGIDEGARQDFQDLQSANLASEVAYRNQARRYQAQLGQALAGGQGGGAGDPFALLTPEQRRMAAILPPDQQARFLSRIASQRASQPRAPTVRTQHLPGGMDQDQQWDEASGDWTNVGQPYSRWQPQRPGEGPIGFKGVEREPTSGELGQWDSRGQFHPLSGGASGPSQAQEANNVEIDQSRNYLTSNGLTRDQILARTQPLDPATGLPNPAYDPGVASMFRTAMQHKVGRDDGYTDFIGRYYPSGRPAASGAGPTALPSTSSASPTPAPGPSSPPPPVPRNTYGQPDASALVPGQLYTVPGANRGPPETWRWDGKNFVQPFPGGPR